MLRWIHRSLFFGAFALPLSVFAQQIDISLHPTAVPDSFTVRLTSTEGEHTYLPNGVFTLRWEVEAGGLMTNADVRKGCPGYSLLNYTGTVDIGNHRYFTLVLLGDRPLDQPGCAITPEGMTIAGVRIRELSGCRHVELVQNAYTGLNNLNYYLSMGGMPLTGVVTSEPIPGGACGPCVPPLITSASAIQQGDCTAPVVLSVEADGTALDLSWYAAQSIAPVGYGSPYMVASGWQAPYLLVASNTCGADTLVVPLTVDSTACVAPTILSLNHVQQISNSVFYSNAIGSCLQYQFLTPSGTIYPLTFRSALGPVRTAWSPSTTVGRIPWTSWSIH